MKRFTTFIALWFTLALAFFKRLGHHLRLVVAGGAVTFEAALSAVVFRADGTIEHLGVIGRKQVTTVFVNMLIDVLQKISGAVTNIQLFQYHDCGINTGDVAEGSADTALTTPFGGARVVGTYVEGSGANVYKTVATIPFTTTQTIKEHGLFNAASGVSLMDRTVFTGIPVNNLDSIQFTYEFTANAGG